MREFNKWLQKLVLDAFLINPPPLMAFIVSVFIFIFAIGYWFAHWMDSVDLSAYKLYGAFHDNIAGRPVLEENATANTLTFLKSQKFVVSIQQFNVTYKKVTKYFTVVEVKKDVDVIAVVENITNITNGKLKPKVTYWTSESTKGWLIAKSNAAYFVSTDDSTLPELKLSLLSNVHDLKCIKENKDGNYFVEYRNENALKMLSASIDLKDDEIKKYINEYKEGSYFVECRNENTLKMLSASIDLKDDKIKVIPANLILHIDLELKSEVGINRFQDNEELRYSLRSLMMYAPWVRQVFLVTNGQIPYWLNLEHPKIKIITHKDIFKNTSYLPTFSSPAIETQIHRISGLSEHFLYLNDDVFFGAEVWPDDFYTPSSGYKVYLAWSLPECSAGCPDSWISDGYCDSACNTSSCIWDGGDCSGNYVLSNQTSEQFNLDPAFSETEHCSSLCTDSWLADNFCDPSCNVAECGFDCGDCGTSNFKNLYRMGYISEGRNAIILPQGTSAAWINMSGIIASDVDINANHTESNDIHSLVINTAQKILVLILKHNAFGLIFINLYAQNTKHISVYEIQINYNTALLPVMPMLPSTEAVFNVSEFRFSKVGPKYIDNDEDNLEYYYKINAKASHLPKDLINRFLELEKWYFAGDISEKAHSRLKNSYLNRVSEYNLRNLVYYSDDEWLTLQSNMSAVNNALRKVLWNKNFNVKTHSDYNDSGLKRNKYDNIVTKGRRKLLDVFAESLLHVNKIYNQEYGFQSRKVLAHIPHFINKTVMKMLLNKYQNEFEFTAAHKLRQGNDMQYAFSYFYFLMSEKRNRSLTEIFHQFDSDKSGTWSDREIRTFLAYTNDLPVHYDLLKEFHSVIHECSKSIDTSQVSTPPNERYADSDIPTVSEELATKCIPFAERLKKLEQVNLFRYTRMTDTPAHFKMINSNISRVLYFLDEIRKYPRKFICLNSNMDPLSSDNEIIHALVQDTLDALFPFPSPFELPANYRNRFVHISELQEWKKWRNCIKALLWASISCLVIISLLSIFGSDIESLKQKWCKTKRRRLVMERYKV